MIENLPGSCYTDKRTQILLKFLDNIFTKVQVCRGIYFCLFTFLQHSRNFGFAKNTGDMAAPIYFHETFYVWVEEGMNMCQYTYLQIANLF